MTGRIEQLKLHLQSRPNDPFLRYAIGIELKNENRLTEALGTLQSLAQDCPAYVPTYYHLGQVLEALSRPEEALAIYEQGIDRASQAKDAHAAEELTPAATMVRDLL